LNERGKNQKKGQQVEQAPEAVVAEEAVAVVAEEAAPEPEEAAPEPEEAAPEPEPEIVFQGESKNVVSSR